MTLAIASAVDMHEGANGTVAAMQHAEEHSDMQPSQHWACCVTLFSQVHDFGNCGCSGYA